MRYRRVILRVLAAVGLVAVVFAATTYFRILRQSRLNEVRRAEAIVVFGAAEYSGRPSPVFRARLDHALALFQQGTAPVIITTGGSNQSAFSEGGVGRDYLLGRGVAEDRLIAETQSANTIESVRRVARIMKTNGMQSCVAVSDDYHIFRIKQMLAREGIRVFGAPRPVSRPVSWRERQRLILREILSYTLWRLGIT